MPQSKHIKDIPMGVLILVLSQFVFYGVIYLAKFPNYLELAGIVFCTLIASDMVSFGIRLIRGFDAELDKQ